MSDYNPAGHGPVDNPVDSAVENAPPRGRDSTILVKDKSLTAREAMALLIEANTYLDARIEALELQVIELLGALDGPINSALLIERIQRLKDVVAERRQRHAPEEAS